MKLVGLVCVGMCLSGIAYMLLIFGIPWAFPSVRENAFLWLPLLIVTPVSFFIGSFFTGYCSYYDVEDKWSLLVMSPALYVNLFWICVVCIGTLIDMPNNRGNIIALGNPLIPVLIGLYWYLVSAGAVVFGYVLRERFAKWWYHC